MLLAGKYRRDESLVNNMQFYFHSAAFTKRRSKFIVSHILTWFCYIGFISKFRKMKTAAQQN